MSLAVLLGMGWWIFPCSSMVVSVLCAFGCGVFKCIAIIFTSVVVDVNLYYRDVSLSVLLRLYLRNVKVQRTVWRPVIKRRGTCILERPRKATCNAYVIYIYHI